MPTGISDQVCHSHSEMKTKPPPDDKIVWPAHTSDEKSASKQNLDRLNQDRLKILLHRDQPIRTLNCKDKLIQKTLKKHPNFFLH